MGVPRNVLITGASSGIGRALALEYASRGAEVALVARREAELEALVREVESKGGRALAFPTDVTSEPAIRETITRADEAMGGIEMVIANAGAGKPAHSSRIDWRDVERLVDLNIKGAMATLLSALPSMLAHQRGHLVVVTSLAGRRGLPKSAVYSASKAAMSAFAESLRVDLAAAGIHVTDVQPGFVATPIHGDAKHPMPFLWSAEKAARVIANRLERAPAKIAFPWPLDLATSFARILPAWAYDLAVRGQG